MTPRNIDSAIRQVSSGAVWNVGGASAAVGPSVSHTAQDSPPYTSITPPTFDAGFLDKQSAAEMEMRHTGRLGLAMDVDPARRILRHNAEASSLGSAGPTTHYTGDAAFWENSSWNTQADLLGKMTCQLLDIHVKRELIPHFHW